MVPWRQICSLPHLHRLQIQFTRGALAVAAVMEKTGGTSDDSRTTIFHRTCPGEPIAGEMLQTISAIWYSLIMMVRILTLMVWMYREEAAGAFLDERVYKGNIYIYIYFFGLAPFGATYGNKIRKL